MCLVEFSQFFGKMGCGVWGMCYGYKTERKPAGTTKINILSKILYIYFEIKVFNAQRDMEVHKNAKLKCFLKDFKVKIKLKLYFKLKCSVRHWDMYKCCILSVLGHF